MKRLAIIPSRKSLLPIYKSFVRPLLDYTAIINGKPPYESFKRKLEPAQCNHGDIIRYISMA